MSFFRKEYILKNVCMQRVDGYHNMLDVKNGLIPDILQNIFFCV